MIMRYLGFIFLLLIALAGTTFAQNQSQTSNNANKAANQMQGSKQAKGHRKLYCDPINISFAQIITSGELKEISQSDNIYRLTISNVSPYLLYYTKRPKRLSGQVSIKNFLKAWKVGKNSFAKNPPNAIIYPGMINQNANRSGDAFRVVITKPQYQAEKSKMTYLVKPLGDSSLIMKDMDLNYSVMFIH